MRKAFLSRDSTYEGVFFTGVRTTGVFCRPTCRARKPRPENVVFYATAQEALVAGYRPCLLCRPLETPGAVPPWLHGIMAAVEADPSRRWRDTDLREQGYQPERVRRWFQRHHGMTFQAYSRARRLGQALGQIRQGLPVLHAAYDQGYESLSGFNAAVRGLMDITPGQGRDTRVVLLTRLSTPLGPMVAGATEEAVCFLEFADRRAFEKQLKTLVSRMGARLLPGKNRLLELLSHELGEYFNAERQSFSVPLTAPGTPFQERVWAELGNIPVGQTASYAAIAARLGQPNAVRAVARANGANRLAILIPCHRVIGSDGKLTGYGGGLWRKQRLLEIEGAWGQ